jgi:hypothetical protein
MQELYSVQYDWSQVSQPSKKLMPTNPNTNPINIMPTVASSVSLNLLARIFNPPKRWGGLRRPVRLNKFQTSLGKLNHLDDVELGLFRILADFDDVVQIVSDSLFRCSGTLRPAVSRADILAFFHRTLEVITTCTNLLLPVAFGDFFCSQSTTWCSFPVGSEHWPRTLARWRC